MSAETGELPWWRRDLLAACRSGEYVEATPWREWLAHELRRFPWLWATLAIGGGVFALAWVRAKGHEITALQTLDPAEAAVQARVLLRAVAAGGALLALTATGFTCAQVWKILRAGRWPLPQARVRRRTPILRGRCLQLRFGLPCLFMVLVAAVAVASALRLLTSLAAPPVTGGTTVSTSISPSQLPNDGRDP